MGRPGPPRRRQIGRKSAQTHAGNGQLCEPRPSLAARRNSVERAPRAPQAPHHKLEGGRGGWEGGALLPRGWRCCCTPLGYTAASPRSLSRSLTL
jgi:hypothetical protein